MRNVSLIVVFYQPGALERKTTASLTKNQIHVMYLFYTLNNIGSLEGTLQYYHHATKGEPLQGSPGVAW